MNRKDWAAERFMPSMIRRMNCGYRPSVFGKR